MSVCQQHLHTASYLGRTYTAKQFENKPELISKSRKDKNLKCPDGCMLSFVLAHPRQVHGETIYVNSHFRHTSSYERSTCGFCTKYGSGGESLEHLDAKAIIAANSNVILTRQCHHSHCRRNIRIPLTGQGIMEYKIAPYFIDVMFDSVAVEIKHSSPVTGAKREMLNKNYIWYEVSSEYEVRRDVYEFQVEDTSGDFFCDGTTCQHGEEMKEKERRDREQATREQEKRKKEAEETWERERPAREKDARERELQWSHQQQISTFTFQHIGTARHRDADYNLAVRLYGRQADGKSVSVTVEDVSAYGYIGVSVDSILKLRVDSLLRWHLSMQRTKSKIKKHKKEEGEDLSIAQQYSNFMWWFAKNEHISVNWSEVNGYNIRSVLPGAGPKVGRFEVYSYEQYRGLCSMFRAPNSFYDSLVNFRRPLDGYTAAPRGTWQEPLEQMPALPASISAHVVDCDLYETMFQPELVWMVDHQLPACSWMTVTNARPTLGGSTCDLNYKCRSESVLPCASPPIPMAPFKVLSYDIEAVPYLNPETDECEFPDPKRDSIVTIGVAAFDMVSAEMKQTVFMLEIEGQSQCQKLSELSAEMKTDEFDPSTTTVCSFTDESKMLAAFAQYIRTYDADVITGYNVLNFDNVYLLQRIQALCGCEIGSQCSDCAKARTFSRIDRPSTLKKKYTHTKQRGGQESWEAWIEGRDWMDVYRVVMSDHKLRSYKLDNVCLELLGTKKIHIDYDEIPKHQETPAGREFLAQYCVKDAWLPCQIIVKRCKLVNAFQMAQVTGVPLTSILHRGQQIRTLVLMLQFVKARCRKDPEHPRWFLPDESGNKPPPIDGFEGAVVIRPLPGFYQTPVVTLDFASLYPSIMRAYNMCFSTLVPSLAEARHRKLEWSEETHDIKDPKDPHYPEVRPVRSFDYPEGGKFEYVPRETDVSFVTCKTRVGILPEILEQLLNERSRIKKLRKKYGEKSMDYAVLDGRQLALKVCANSVYGFTGAGMGYLGEKRIASSVTRVGRGMANHTKWMCEDKYKDHGLQIVYGDTDSVFAEIPASMCDTNCTQEELIAKVDKIGDEMGKFCTQAFLPPNDLEYEKFYYPILLKGKKRYAGHKFEPGLAPKLDVKGFECVRRDFAPIVSKTQKEILIKLCKENDVQGAIDLARETVVRLLENDVPIEDLTMSKQLTRRPEDYKNPAPHTELAKRLQREQPAHIAPKTGDRIPYLIRPGYKGEKTCMRAVTPEDVRSGRESADTRWYLSNQLQKPLQRIFEMVMENASEIFEVNQTKTPQTISDDMMRTFVQRTAVNRAVKRKATPIQAKAKRRKTKPKDIRSFFN